jgi:hypothetical protein
MENSGVQIRRLLKREDETRRTVTTLSARYIVPAAGLSISTESFRPEDARLAENRGGNTEAKPVRKRIFHHHESWNRRIDVFPEKSIRQLRHPFIGEQLEKHESR